MPGRGGLRAVLARRQSGQNLLEFGLVLPLFVSILMVGLQLSILFVAQMAVIWLTQDMARYMSSGTPQQHWRFPDSCHIAYRNSRLTGLPLIQQSNFKTVAVPSGTPLPSGIGFDPPYTPGVVDCNTQSNNVPQPEDATPPRVRGSWITVSMQYNPTNLLFLPNTFFGVPVLQTLPLYSASKVME